MTTANAIATPKILMTFLQPTTASLTESSTSESSSTGRSCWSTYSWYCSSISATPYCIAIQNMMMTDANHAHMNRQSGKWKHVSFLSAGSCSTLAGAGSVSPSFLGVSAMAASLRRGRAGNERG